MDFNDLAFLMGGDASEADASAEYRNIWVVAEVAGEGVSRTSRQALGKARELGDRLGVRVEAVLLGHQLEAPARTLVGLGADVVYTLDSPELAAFSGDLWVKLLAELVGAKRPEIVLMGFTSVGKEVAPRLAQRLGTGLVADAQALDLDESERLLIATRSSFGGRALATVTCPKARPQMATVHPNAFRDPESDPTRDGTIEAVSVAIDPADRRVSLRATAPAPSEVPLERARLLVVGGKGLGGPEGALALQQLASALGGQVAGTRSAIEAGWFPANQEVSGRGTTVAPELYIGVGVSGSMDHVDSMRQSRTIVAINSNAEAPLMELADYALVGDWRQLVPALLATLEGLRAKRVAASVR